MAAVAALGFVEDVADDVGGVSVTLAVNHLPVATGPAVAASRSVSLAGRMSVAVRDDGRRVIDGADLRDSLAVALLALGQAGLELARHRRRCLCVAARSASGRITTPLPSQESTNTSPCSTAAAAGAAVEGVKVARATAGEILDLALAQSLAGRAPDRRRGVFERAPGGLDRRQPAQPVRVALDRQVEQRVGPVQLHAPRAR